MSVRGNFPTFASCDDLIRNACNWILSSRNRIPGHWGILKTVLLCVYVLLQYITRFFVIVFVMVCVCAFCVMKF
jgi:hypothetical protein